MAGPRDLVVRFLSDVTGFLSGTDEVASALRDVATATETTSTEGETNADRLARAYRDAAAEMGTGATEGQTHWSAKTQEVVNKGVASVAKTGKATMKSLGKNLAGDMSTGIAMFNPADIGGSIGGLLGSVSVATPVGAAAVAIGGLLIKGLVDTINSGKAEIEKVGSIAAKALSDGALTEANKIDLVQAALGVDNFGDLTTKLYAWGDAMKIPAKDIFDYMESGGTVVSAAMAKALADGAQAVTTHTGDMTKEGVAAYLEMTDATNIYNTGLGNANDLVDKQNILLGKTLIALNKIAVANQNLQWAEVVSMSPAALATHYGWTAPTHKKGVR